MCICACVGICLEQCMQLYVCGCFLCVCEISVKIQTHINISVYYLFKRKSLIRIFKNIVYIYKIYTYTWNHNTYMYVYVYSL